MQVVSYPVPIKITGHFTAEDRICNIRAVRVSSIDAGTASSLTFHLKPRLSRQRKSN
jgi:hypothetical protein